MKKILPIIKIIFILTIIIWVGIKVDLKKIKDIISNANLFFGFLFLLFNISGAFILVFRWKIIIHGFWNKLKISIFHLFYINMLSVFYMLFIPTSIAGETFRIFKLSQKAFTDYKSCTLVVALDRFTGALTWLIIFMISPSPLKNTKFWIVSFIGLTLFIIFRKKIKFFEHKVFDFSRHHPKDIAKGIIISILGQSLYIFSNYMLFKCLGIKLTFVQTCAVTSASALAGIVPISWLGISLREGSYLGLLPLYGVSSTMALVFMSSIIFSNYFFGLIAGFIELIKTGWNFSNFKINSEEKTK